MLLKPMVDELVEAGHSQLAISKVVGTSQSTISRVQTGGTDIPFSKGKKIELLWQWVFVHNQTFESFDEVNSLKPLPQDAA